MALSKYIEYLYKEEVYGSVKEFSQNGLQALA